MKSKKGSHVGMVLSFVIFVIFIFFIYLVTQPAIKTESKSNSLEYLADNLQKQVSSNVTSAAISLQNSQSCVILSGFLSTVNVGNSFKVGNYSGKQVQAQVSSNDLVLVRDTNDFFFNVYGSSAFPNATTGTPGSCQVLNRGGGYEIGLVKTDKIVVEPLIANLIVSYASNYNGIKSTLQVSQVNEFDFSFTYSNGTTVYATNPNLMIPNGTNVYAKNSPITYISNNGALEPGMLNVRMWRCLMIRYKKEIGLKR